MEKFGDPGFRYHRTLAQLWALLALELADRELLPFDIDVYASAVNDYVKDLEGYAKAKGAKENGFDLAALHGAADELTKNAAEFDRWGKAWEKAVGMGGFESNVMAIKRMSHNSRMGNFETHLLDVGGGVSDSDLPELHMRVELTKQICSCLGGSSLCMSYSHHKLGVDTMKHTFLASEMQSTPPIGSWLKNSSTRLRASSPTPVESSIIEECVRGLLSS